MSKRHSELIQLQSNNEANAEKEGFLKVPYPYKYKYGRVALHQWSAGSRAFIHAYRIVEQIIEHEHEVTITGW